MKLLKEYSHPSLVTLFEVYESNQYLYLIFEETKDDILFSQIKKISHYTEGDARKIMTSLLEAINHLHNNQIMHRDIKPSNILLFNYK